MDNLTYENGKEFWTVERSISQQFAGTNRPTNLYNVAGSFFWHRSMKEAEEELEAAGFQLLKMHGMKKGYSGVARKK